MDAFFGTWKLVKKVNFAEFMKAVGLQGNDDTLSETVSKEGDHFVWIINKGKHTTEMKFKLDKAFHDGTTIEGKQCLSTISLKGKHLVQVKKWDHKEIVVIREVNGKNMTATVKFGGVEGHWIYEKV